MKLGVHAVILAIALTSVTAAEQGKPKDKGRPPATKEKAPNPDRGKDPSPAVPGSSSATQCSPDTTAPVIASVSATPASLWPPNHKMTPVTISASVTDNCPGAPTWSVTSVTSNEPINGTGDGDTAPDWTIAGPHAVSLRAERAGTGSGRTYTVTIAAKDAAGNTATGTTSVTVAHNQ